MKKIKQKNSTNVSQLKNPFRKRFTLAEVMIAGSILVVFLSGIYELFRFVSKTARRNAFIEGMAINENVFFRKFTEVNSLGSVPARISFPDKPTTNANDVFKIDENKNYGMFLRNGVFKPSADPAVIEPILDIYESSSEKLNFPLGHPTTNQPLLIKRHCLILTSNGAVKVRTQTLSYKTFNELKNSAPSPANSTRASWDKFDSERTLLTGVDVITLNPKATNLNDPKSKPEEQKIKLRVVQGAGERFKVGGVEPPTGSYKEIEFSFIPLVPVQLLPF